MLTVSVQTPCSPAVIVSGPSFVTLRSAAVPVMNSADASLSLGSGSVADDVTVAVFTLVVTSFVFTVTGKEIAIGSSSTATVPS